MHRLLPVALVSVALASCQTPDAAPGEPSLEELLATHELPEVIARLRSREAADVAWGGFFVAQQGLHAAPPEVRAALARWAQDPTEDGECVRVALLDALVQLEVDLPDAEIVPHLDGNTRGAAFVLLARHPREHAATLLSLFRAGAVGRCACAEWIAAGHLLAEERSPGFAQALLAAVHRVTAIAVSAPIPTDAIGHCGGASISYRRTRHLHGFPPPLWRQLSLGPSAGALVLTEHAPRVFAAREPVSSAVCDGTQNTDALLRLWLAEVADVGPAWEPEPQLVASSPDEYRRSVAALRAERQSWFAVKTTALQAAGRLTAAEAAALRRDVEIVVEDWRDTGAAPLPDLPGVRVLRPFDT